MTIGNYTVTGEDPQEQASGFRIGFLRDIQLRKGFRRSEVQPSNRLNQVVTVSFMVPRLHSDYQAALIYLMDHSQNLPTEGEVKFEHSLDGEQVIRRFNAAHVSAAEGEPVGATTLIRYTVVGDFLTT